MHATAWLFRLLSSRDYHTRCWYIFNMIDDDVINRHSPFQAFYISFCFSHFSMPLGYAHRRLAAYRLTPAYLPQKAILMAISRSSMFSISTAISVSRFLSPFVSATSRPIYHFLSADTMSYRAAFIFIFLIFAAPPPLIVTAVYFFNFRYDIACKIIN